METAFKGGLFLFAIRASSENVFTWSTFVFVENIYVFCYNI